MLFFCIWKLFANDLIVFQDHHIIVLCDNIELSSTVMISRGAIMLLYDHKIVLPNHIFLEKKSSSAPFHMLLSFPHNMLLFPPQLILFKSHHAIIDEFQ